MRETRPGGDPINNLYSPGGILEKYDRVFGRASQAHERAYGFRPFDSTDADAGWAGHCNNASEIACLLEEPRNSVSFGGEVFSPEEIKGLLVLISDALSIRIDFRGERYNGPSDDPFDPSPELVLDTLKRWGEDKRPFVMDIEPRGAVWNYPYDQVEVTETDVPPPGYDPRRPGPDGNHPAEGGQTLFYEFALAGTGYDSGEDDERRSYRGWIHVSDSGARTSGWLEGSDSRINPDFLWRPEPNPDGWAGKSRLNPEVLPSEVHQLYLASVR